MNASEIVRLTKNHITEVKEIKKNLYSFSKDGGKFFLATDEDDKNFVQLLFPSFWHYESEDDSYKALSVAYMSTKKIKSAKIYIIEKSAWATVEVFSDSEKSFSMVFTKYIDAMLAAAQYFKNEIGADGNN